MSEDEWETLEEMIFRMRQSRETVLAHILKNFEKYDIEIGIHAISFRKRKEVEV